LTALACAATSEDGHLAQVNVARLRAPLDAPAMAGLGARIAELNRLAEASRGFVWRMCGADVTRDALRAFDGYLVPFDPDRIFYNLSVWESVEHLRAYVFGSAHAAMLRARHAWIEPLDLPHLALWWVPVGARPTVAASAERLRVLAARGPTPFAFGFEGR
jgi:hypothetical protein